MRYDRRNAGFTLVELLVVIGIIGLLVGLLMPRCRARAQANSIYCQSNLKQLGAMLVIYSNQNRGWLYPVGELDPATNAPKTLGTNVPRDERWPVYVYDPPVWNPPTMTCPIDLEPAEEHTYIVNMHLAVRGIKFSGGDLGSILTSSDTVVAGEKKTTQPDYYMARGPSGADNSEFDRVVEPFRHGGKLGSNYLYLDMHVSTVPPNEALAGIDPWEGGLPPALIEPVVP